MNRPQADRLSDAGRARREAMLGELIGAVERTRRVRRARRFALAIGAAACAVLVFSQLRVPDRSPQEQSNRIVDGQSSRDAAGAARTGPIDRADKADPEGGSVAEDDAGGHRRHRLTSECVTTVVRTDPAVIQRFRAVPTNRAIRLDNAALERTLKAIDRPARLLRKEDGLQLSAPVTDRELGL